MELSLEITHRTEESDFPCAPTAPFCFLVKSTRFHVRRGGFLWPMVLAREVTPLFEEIGLSPAES
jgi:hypothetical protein